MRYQSHRHKHRIIGFVLSLLVIGGIVGAWKFVVGRGSDIAPADDQAVGQITGRPSPKVVSSRTLIFGGMDLRGSVDESARAASQRFPFPFKPLDSFNRSGYDAWLSSLECPLGDSGASGSSSCDGGYVDSMGEWFNVLALGNDAVGSQGEGAFTSTTEKLDASNIQHIGSYDSNNVAKLCDIVNLPARYTLNDGSFKEATMPLAVCSINTATTIPVDLVSDTIRKFSEVLPTWVFADNNSQSTALDTQLYRTFIDAGASVVLGTNKGMPLVESYEGKLIVHSLGGFIGNRPENNLGMGLSIEIEAQLDQSVLLWTRLSPECAKPADTCIETAAYQGLVLPKYAYKFDTVSLSINDSLLVEKGTAEANETLQDMIGWADVLEALVY